MLKVSRDDVVAVMRELGFPMAKGWNKKRTTKKLCEIAEMAAADGGLAIEETDKLEAAEAARLDEILQAIVAAGGDVEVLVDGETDLGGGTEDEKDGPALGGTEVAGKEDKPAVEDKPKKRRGRPPKVMKVEDKLEEPKKKRGRSPKMNTKSVRGELGPVIGDGKHQGIRSLRNRLFQAGVVLKEHGLEDGVTDELIAEVDGLSGKPNRVASKSQLGLAWHVLNGFLNG